MEIAVTFLTRRNGIFNVTISNSKLFFANSKTDKGGFILTTTPTGAYEIKSFRIEIKRMNIEGKQFTEAIYTFTNEPNGPILGSFLDISRQRNERFSKAKDLE